MRVKVFLFLLLMGLSAVAGAKPDMTVGVSILPQKYFVERIAGDSVEVIVMVESGYNPATYEPRPKQLTNLNRASVFFLAGVPFETKWVKVFSKNNPSMVLVSMTNNIALRHYEESQAGKHSHGEEDDHSNNIDPHFWLNPLLVKVAAKTILDSFVEKNPSKEKFYLKNYRSFIHDLEKLDQKIREQLSKAKHKNFAVFHPSWGYFSDAYGLKQIAIEVQNRQSGARTLNETINRIKSLGIRVIFVQKQFSETDARMIARETETRLVQVDPLAENYLDNMKYISGVFSESLQ